MFKFIFDFIQVYGSLVGIGLLLNQIATPGFASEFALYFGRRKWALSDAVRSFIENTFYPFFGSKLFSLKFFLASLALSAVGLLFFSLVFYLLNDEPACRYPLDWCQGLNIQIVREGVLLLAAIFIIDVLSFAQTALLIRFAMIAKNGLQLAFLAYADVVLTIALFTFVMPAFLMFNFVFLSQGERVAEVYVQIRKEPFVVREKIEKDLSPKDAEFAKILEDLVENDDLSKLGEQNKLDSVSLNFYYDDGDKRLRNLATVDGYAKGNAQQIENLFMSLVRDQKGFVDIQEKALRFSDEDSSRVIFVKAPFHLGSPVALYSALYGQILLFNQQFWFFLRGSPVFVEASKIPLFSLASNQRPTERYLCLCPSGPIVTDNPLKLLNNDYYAIVRASGVVQLGASYMLAKFAERKISLSVFFATSMSVTILFYFGLLLWLVPAYAFRNATLGIIGALGERGKENSIAIAIAMGALPVALMIVLLSSLF